MSEATALYFNDGQSWRELFVAKQTRDAIELVGVRKDGTTVLRGLNELFYVRPDGSGAALGSADDHLSVRSAYLYAGADRVYGTGRPTLFALEHGEAIGLGMVDPSSAAAVWGDAERVFLAGALDFFLDYSFETRELVADPTVPAGDYTAVWGFDGANDDEVWLGNSVGQLVHRLGGVWSVVDTNASEPIEQLWGSEGTIYFHTDHFFGRASAEASELLVSLDAAGDETVGAMWGLSKQEVFVALHKDVMEEFACGGLAVLWFDGEIFHRM